MKQRFFNAAATFFLTIVIFGVGYWLGQSPYAPVNLFIPGGPAGATESSLNTIWEVHQLLQRYYFSQPLDQEQLTQGAIDGMLATLEDPNTRYLPPESESAARATMEGELEGIGAEVTNEDGNIVVVAPFEGSPAASAGIRPGDILREADGVPLTGMDVGEAAALVRGPAGTTVELLIERDGEQFTLRVERDVIRVPSVRGEMLADNIAYVRLSRFGNSTADELETILAELLAQSPTGLILDLRSNPGGSLTTAVGVADQFLPEGVILIERFGDGREETHESSDEGLAQDIPLVVLIDEGSASASEVLAGAIRDYERGVLIGVTSFGKGTVQTWQSLENGGGVRITVARWLTPEGTWVHEAGLEPDYRIPLPEEFSGDDDPQLQAAIDYLLGRPVVSVPAEESAEEQQ
jgi:carboxyl-terminal processing protease